MESATYVLSSRIYDCVVTNEAIGKVLLFTVHCTENFELGSRVCFSWQVKVFHKVIKLVFCC
jgi:hypothetical protein